MKTVIVTLWVLRDLLVTSMWDNVTASLVLVVADVTSARRISGVIQLWSASPATATTLAWTRTEHSVTAVLEYAHA